MKPEPAVDLRGAIDLHLHASPSLFPRLATDREVAEAAWQAGFAAILLKSHHESTVARAAALDGLFPGLRVFGGIVLNRYVGGLNPQAVCRALEGGARQVWLPTIDAAHHAQVFGGTGSFDAQSSPEAVREARGIQLVHEGRLLEEVEEILRLIASHDAILGTGHNSYDELCVVVPRARELGVRKILLTHPFFKTPGLTLERTQELVAAGAMAEFTYCTISPHWAYASARQVAEAIKTLGAGTCILTSDAGQAHNPMPPEALRIFAQELFGCSVAQDELDLLLRRNPARIVGLTVK